MPFPLPADEDARRRELHSFKLLDTPPEEAFDHIVELAAEICEVPIAMVSLIDEERQWFKARTGVDAQQTPRDQAFCAHAILNPSELLIVRDAHEDHRFSNNPLVTGNPHIRFYAGAPLQSNGQGMGTLCVIDREPRMLKPSQQRALRVLSEQVTHLMELHRERIRSEHGRVFLNTVMETLAEGVIVRDRQRRLVAHNTMASVLLGTDLAQLIGQTFSMLQYKPVQPNGFAMPTEELPSYKALATGQEQRDVVFGITRSDGQQKWLESNASILHDPIYGDCAVISFRDVSDRKALENQLQNEASSDTLTGLPNRRAFLEQLNKAIAAATRYKHAMCLCIADLDHLKLINDRHGHAAGDAALRRFSMVLRASLRYEDSAARLGGDEFIAVFPYVGASQAACSLERMRNSLANTEVLLENGEKILLSGSFGIADWKPGMSSDQLIEAADKVLYAAKNAGRNRIAVGA